MIPCTASQNNLNPYNDKNVDEKFPTTKTYDLTHFDVNVDYSMMRINETFKLFGEVYQRIKINTSSKEVVSELQDLLILLEEFRQYTKILASSTLGTKGNESQTYFNLTGSELNFSGDADFSILNDNAIEFFSHTLGRINCTILIESDNGKHHNGSKNTEICNKLDFDDNSNDRSWNELTSKEQTELLLQALGPQTKYGDKKVLIPTVFYSTVSFLGFPGNLLMCLTIGKNDYMKTAANWLIFNLVITDLVTLLLVIPMEITLFWSNYPIPLGEWGCDMAIVTSELVTYVSILTMIAFTLERYFAICHPTNSKLQFIQSHIVPCILAIWTFGLIAACCWTSFTIAIYLYYHPQKNSIRDTIEQNETLSNDGYTLVKESAMCMPVDPSVTPGIVVLESVYTTLLYFLPILVLPAVYIRISKALYESRKYRHDTPGRDNNMRYTNMKSAI